jgi:hypothetical protein
MRDDGLGVMPCIRSFCIAVLAFCFLAMSNAAIAQQCDLPTNYTVALNDEALDRIGYEPESELMQFISLRELQLSFSQPFEADVPINEVGDTTSVEVVAISISFVGDVNSIRQRFLQEVSRYLPTPGRNDSTGVSGGFMSLMGRDQIRVNGTIWYEDRSSDVSWWDQGGSRTPVWLNVDIDRSQNLQDFSISPRFESGPTSVSSPLGDFLDIIFAPITIGLDILGEPSISEGLIERPVGQQIDDFVDSQAQEIQRYLDRDFRVGSINNLAQGEALRFMTIFREALFVSENAGFSGENPPPITFPAFGGITLPAVQDADIQISIAKSSRRDEVSSLIRPEQACLLLSAVKVLESINSEVTGAQGQEIVASTGETFSEISRRAFSTDRYAMTIAQANGVYSPREMPDPDSFVAPRMSDAIHPNSHFVQPGDTIWSILESRGIDPERYSEVEDFEKYLSNGDLIYPGMVIDLTPLISSQ